MQFWGINLNLYQIIVNLRYKIKLSLIPFRLGLFFILRLELLLLYFKVFGLAGGEWSEAYQVKSCVYH